MNETRLQGSLLRHLKSRGQLLKPVVHAGKEGLSAAFVAAVDKALSDHELIKVRNDGPKETRKTVFPELATRTGSHLVQTVGHVGLLYRPHPDPDRRRIEPDHPSPKTSD